MLIFAREKGAIFDMRIAEKNRKPLTHSHRVRQARTGHCTGHRRIVGQQAGVHAKTEKALIAVNEEQPSIISVRCTKQKCYLNSVSAFGFSVSVVGLELSVCS